MKTLISIKADKEIKEKAQKVAAQIGIPLSTLVNAYLREFVRTKRVDFSLERRRLRPEVERQIQKALDDFKRGKNIAGPFSTATEMDRYLNS